MPHLELIGPLAWIGPVDAGDIVAGDGSLALLIFYAVLAIGFSFLCSIAEAVLLSVTPSHIATLRNQGRPAAALLEKLKENIDRPLAAILSLNTIAHTVGATGVGAEAAAVWGSNVIGLVSAVMTLLILVLSEIIPKTIGAVYWRPLAPTVARAVQWLVYLLLPLVWLSDLLTRLIAGSDRKGMVTREEVAAMATLSAEDGNLDHGETRILHNLFRLESLSARDIMTPRIVLIAFPESMTVGEALASREIPVSRIPIYGASIDEVTGIVLKMDMLLAQANGQQDKRLSELRRDLKAVRYDATLKELLELLLDEREHLALVVGDYGGTEGLVTLEDLIETLLGIEIVDEADTAVDMQALARERWQHRVEQLGIDIGDLETDDDGRPAPRQPAESRSESRPEGPDGPDHGAV